MKKWKLLPLIAVAMLTACSTETTDSLNGTTTDDDNTIISSELLYDLPTAISSATPEDADEVTLAKQLTTQETDEEINLYDFYKPVPIYIHLANEAKNGVKNFIKELAQYDIPAEYDADIDNGLHISSKTIDTLGLQFFTIAITKGEEKVLTMKYFKNSDGNYKGRFFYSDANDGNLGNKAYIHFNGFNDTKKMTVIYKNESGLYGEKHNDDEPTAVMVRTIKNGDKILVKGVSIHPTFTDSFITEGETIPSTYVFKAAANVEENRGVLRAALAPKDAEKDSIFTKYSLDNVVLEAGVRAVKVYLNENTDVSTILLPLMGIETVEELTGEKLEQFLTDYPAVMENDKGLQRFYTFIKTKQPIHLQGNAKLVGYESDLEESEKTVKKELLEDMDIEDIDIEMVESFDMENGTDSWNE